MILLDTHEWIWWGERRRETAGARSGPPGFKSRGGPRCRHHLVLGSCQNVALGRIQLDRDVRDWISTALDLPGVRLLGLSPEIVVDSTRLPAPFHRDPADQLIVATSRVLNIPLLTQDARLLDYPFVEKAPAV